jgi:GrpB-like predicted nucleotidyltransferase (UPF0157 family)
MSEQQRSGAAVPAPEFVAGAGPEPVAGKIEIRDYDPAWPAVFEAEAARIGAALGAAALAIDHTGSTSVPGLAAKPIIDITLTVPDTTDEPAYVGALEAAGYRFIAREPGWFEHRLFKGEAPKVNLHVFPAGCPEVDRMKRFRDWLRANPADRALYERTKRRLAAQDWAIVQDYADAKTEVVAQIMQRATPSR